MEVESNDRPNRHLARLGLSLVLALGVLLGLGIVLSDHSPRPAQADSPLQPFWEEHFSTSLDSTSYYTEGTPGSGVISDGSFLLTQAITNQHSRLWYIYTQTLMSEFTATFSLNFGSYLSPTVHAGGDGIAFAMCPHYQYEPPRSSGLVDAQCPGGYLLDFDTNEPVSVPAGGDRVYVAFEDQAERLAQQDVADLETGQWYTATVEFNMGTMNVSLNGNRVLTDAHLPDYTPFWGYFGFAADTSAAWNPQSVDDIQVNVAPAQRDLQHDIVVDQSYGPGTTGWGVNATNSVTRAMWMVEPRGSVRVMPGTYATTWVMPLINGGRYTPTLWLRPRVSVRGSGPWATALDGQGLNRTVWGDYNISSSEVFSGFTVRGGDIYNLSRQYGGGLDLWAGQEEIANLRVIGNRGLFGGGISLFQSKVMLVNTIVADNVALSSGSGVWISNSRAQPPRLVYLTVARNTGAEGSGIRVRGTSTAYLTNTIIAAQVLGVDVADVSIANMQATLWGNGAWANGANTHTSGTGEIIPGTSNSGDPAFVDPATGDYHITIDSAARDWAVATSPSVRYDIDDQPRPYGPKSDLGADEFWPVLTSTLYMPAVARD